MDQNIQTVLDEEAWSDTSFAEKMKKMHDDELNFLGERKEHLVERLARLRNPQKEFIRGGVREMPAGIVSWKCTPRANWLSQLIS